MHVLLDYGVFFEKATDYLAGKGRTGLAVLAPADVMPIYEAVMRKKGLSFDPYWGFPLDTNHGPTAERITHLLLRTVPRPDGLIVADDNLVESAIRGMNAANVSVGQELDVVTHCNWPLLEPSVLPPVRRLGFDNRQMLHVAIDCAIKQRRGEPTPKRLRVAPLFEEELERPVGARRALGNLSLADLTDAAQNAAQEHG